MKKFILIVGIVFLLLISSVSAMDIYFNGVLCSPDTTLYEDYNTVGANFSVNTDFTFQRNANWNVTVYVVNLRYSALDAPDTAPNVVLYQADGTPFGGVVRWDTQPYITVYNDTTPSLSGVPVKSGVINQERNFTMFVNTTFDKIGYRTDFGNGSGAISYIENLGIYDNSKSFGKLTWRPGSAAPTVGYDAILRWNGTTDGCPTGAPPPAPPSPTNSTATPTPVYELSTNTYGLKLEHYNLTTSTTADLYYNGTYYSGTINYTNSSYVVFNVSIASPIVYINNSVISPMWNITLNYSNGTIVYDTADQTTQYVLWNLTAMPRMNISAFDILNNSKIKFFTVSDGSLELSTTTGEVYYYSSAGIHELTIDNSTYQLKAANVTFTSGSYGSYVFNLYTTNSFNLTFLDERTNTTINKDITVEFISDTTTYNFTATNGTHYLDVVIPETYTIRYSADGYGLIREYRYILTNRSYQNLYFYMIDETNGTTVSVTVYNQYDLNTVEGAIVYIQRFYPNDNVYKTVAMYSTDVAGKSYFDVELNDQYYKILVDYPFGTRKFTSNPFYFSTTSYNTYINLVSDVGTDFFNEQGISAGISYNNATDAFTATWVDSSAVATQYCLYIKKYGQYSLQILNSSCSSSTSGSIVLSGLENATINYALFTATIDGTERVLMSRWKEKFTDELSSARMGLFATIMIVMILSFVLSLHTIALVLGTSGLVFAKLLGVLTIDWAYIFAIFFASLILTVILNIWKNK